MLERYLDFHPQIAADAWVHRAAVVIGNVTLGSQSTVWPNATIRGDDGAIGIGARTSIQDGAVIHMTENLSTTQLGDQVTVGAGVTVGFVVGPVSAWRGSVVAKKEQVRVALGSVWFYME